MKPTRKKMVHETPSWIGGVSPECFFVTICCNPQGRNQLAHDNIWNDLIETVENRNIRKVWQCRLLLAMPDHLHALMLFEGEKRMKDTIRDWKRWTARGIGIEWQDGFFDHRLRNQDSAQQKHDYILQNPVRAGLCSTPEDWPYWKQW